jgi:hypothetical protein
LSRLGYKGDEIENMLSKNDPTFVEVLEQLRNYNLGFKTRVQPGRIR